MEIAPHYPVHVRILAWTLISVINLIYGYLLLYYSTLRLLGTTRLYGIFGQEFYNAIYPGGGLNAVIFWTLFLIVWTCPVWMSICFAYFPSRWIAANYKIAFIPVLVSVAATALFLGVFTYKRSFIDGPFEYIASYIVGNDTIFSEHYTDRGYRRIKVGMTRSEVESILGKPLREWPTTWCFADSASSSSHWVRNVIFDENGKVQGLFHEFYVD